MVGCREKSRGLHLMPHKGDDIPGFRKSSQIHKTSLLLRFILLFSLKVHKNPSFGFAIRKTGLIVRVHVCIFKINSQKNIEGFHSLARNDCTNKLIPIRSSVSRQVILHMHQKISSQRDRKLTSIISLFFKFLVSISLSSQNSSFPQLKNSCTANKFSCVLKIYKLELQRF